MENNDYHKLYRFLNGELEQAEEAAFRDRLAKDPELRAEMRFHQDLLAGVELLGDQQLLASIQEEAGEAKAQGFTITDDQIIHYLNNELGPEQTKVFHQRLEGDKEFSREVTFQKDLLTGVEVSGDEDLMAQIKTTHANLEEEGFFQGATHQSGRGKKQVKGSGKIRSLFSIRSIAIAASFLLILAIGYFLFPSSNNFESLYTAHYTSDQVTLEDQLNQLSLIGMAIPDKARRESLKAALDLFEAGEYAVTISALEAHLSTFPEDEAARYFLGLSLMEEGQFARAVTSFAALAESADTTLQNKARWYQGLSYLRSRGGKTQAMVIFEELADNPESAYQGPAKEVLTSLTE